jgi:hypothetical protein
MEVWLTYLIVGTAFLFLITSYKFQKPFLGIFSGVLFFFMAFSFYGNAVIIPNGSSINQLNPSENVSTYDVNTNYIDVQTSTGISSVFWGSVFLMVAIWIVAESFIRAINFRQDDLFKEFRE